MKSFLALVAIASLTLSGCACHQPAPAVGCPTSCHCGKCGTPDCKCVKHAKCAKKSCCTKDAQ